MLDKSTSRTWKKGFTPKNFGLGKDVPGYHNRPTEALRITSMHGTPRAWQVRACDKLNEILKNDNYAYLSAPTGTGKTFCMALYGEKFTMRGIRAIIVGREQLVKQHCQSLLGYGWTWVNENKEEVWMSSPKGDSWVICTRQAAAADARRMAKGSKSSFINSELALLFFDECQLGGSVKGDQIAKCELTLIRNAWKPVKQIYVSATSFSTSEALLGKRDGHMFTYSMCQAYEDGLLHVVNLIRVDTGTTVDVQRIERLIGTSLEQVAGEDLNSLRTTLNEEGVQIPSKKGEEEEKARNKFLTVQATANRHDCMIAEYAAKRMGNRALFYCPSIAWAKIALKIFQARCPSLSADIVHSKKKKVEESIACFKSGDTIALFAVDMLQEGYDDPGLRLTFDCRFNLENRAPDVARRIQRIGRLTRLDPSNTSPKEYWYANDLMALANSSAQQIPSVPCLSEAEAKYNVRDVLGARRRKQERQDAEMAGIAEDLGLPDMSEAVEEDHVRVSVDAEGNTVVESYKTSTVALGSSEVAKVKGSKVVSSKSIVPSRRKAPSNIDFLNLRRDKTL
jgi:superfamily II DNA or RNA helicase